jgi:hypothetical protein
MFFRQWLFVQWGGWWAGRKEGRKERRERERERKKTDSRHELCSQRFSSVDRQTQASVRFAMVAGKHSFMPLSCRL